MLPWALALAEHGYQGLVVDLRNHGASGDAPAGYGTREADDVIELLARLRARGGIVDPVHLFGMSYGAATALFAAQRLDDEVAGVVALAPFANAGDAVRTLVATLRNARSGTWRSRLARWMLAWRYGDEAIADAIATAGGRLALDLDEVERARAHARARACTLLLHGARDRMVAPMPGKAMAQGLAHVG